MLFITHIAGHGIDIHWLTQGVHSGKTARQKIKILQCIPFLLVHRISLQSLHLLYKVICFSDFSIRLKKIMF
ncbi:hypothetical protein YA35_13515 [Klebsiella aerogenes]|nr:hypothetical protein YA35_13515 [Klebsiella aerogenes]